MLEDKGISEDQIKVIVPAGDFDQPPLHVLLQFPAQQAQAELSPDDAATIIGGNATFDDILGLCQRRGLVRPLSS